MTHGADKSETACPPLNEAQRVRQGADARTEPSVLQALANDDSVTVRAAVAMNTASPAQVDYSLARDPDERVRILLARRLAGLLPTLVGEEQARLQNRMWETLTVLVADTAVRVRAAIADVLKSMPEAPRAIILQLAQDPEVMVSAPVIRFSPLLTTEDLLDLIAAAHSPGTVIAAAAREGIDARVSAAVAATSDNAAIRALLSNRTAHIREGTLDALIARAAEHHDWHELLVRRPALSPRAVRALADIVAAHLLEVLVLRADLPPALAGELHYRLGAQLHPDAPALRGDVTADEALAEAYALARSNRLNEETVLEAARRGDVHLGAALLSIAAGVPLSVVNRAASLCSAKGLVSLAWKAGFSMRGAGAVQAMLGRLGPDAALPPGPGGGFPLAIEEMRWQLDFLSRTGR